MKLTYTEAVRQISALAEQLQNCESIETRNEIECELRALEMVAAYHNGITCVDDERSTRRAAA
jgi:hypothetical protein